MIMPSGWLIVNKLQDDFDLEEEKPSKEKELNNIKHYSATAPNCPVS